MSVGTPKKVTIDAIPFNVMADANFNQTKGKYANEGVVTTGGIIKKQTLRAQMVESINLQASALEADTLKTLSEKRTNIPMSYQIANGDTFRATGFVHFESHDTDAGLAVVTMTPDSVDGWALFDV